MGKNNNNNSKIKIHLIKKQALCQWQCLLRFEQCDCNKI